MNKHSVTLQHLARVLGGEISGSQVRAPGPNHSPKDRSLSVTLASQDLDGFVVYSHAGDDTFACKDYVRSKLGLPDWEPQAQDDPVARMQARSRASSGHDQPRRVAAEYVYRDCDGQPSRKVVRTDGKDFPQYRWNGSAWQAGVKGVPLYPYQLPDMLKAAHSVVYVCEGEKDADRLAGLGFVATTDPMGAGKWHPDLNQWFEGKDCYVLEDNDQAGRDHVQGVARYLHGIADSVRIVRLPGLPEKGDISDWLDADPARSDGLAEYVKSLPLWTPDEAPMAPSGGPAIASAASLRMKKFDPIRYIVPGYIAEGCTLLAGRPKLGKSWLMLDVGLAVAGGRYCLGDTKCEQGDVLYLALEDNERRLQSRITKILGTLGSEWPEQFQYATEWPRANAGGLDAIRDWIKAAKNPRLVVVDVLAMFKPASGNRDNQYEADYHAIKGLQAIASEFQIAIVIVHHTRKSGSDVDPFRKDVSGTLGLSGAADTCIILDRDGSGATLYGRGRDVEEIEAAVEFDRNTCRWRILGAASDVRRTDERGIHPYGTGAGTGTNVAR